MTQDTSRAKPWVLLLKPWNRHVTVTVSEHFSEGQAVGAAKAALLINQRQTAYIGLMTTAMGVKKSEDALLVIMSPAREGTDAWEDHFAPNWPGTGPKG